IPIVILLDYIEKKIDQKAKTADFLRLGGINERQAAMLSIINNNPQTAFTIKELENRFAVSHPTVKADVDALVARGLLNNKSACKTACNQVNCLIFIYSSIPVRSTRTPLGRDSQRGFCVGQQNGTSDRYLCTKHL
ncbi:MAG: hypothetical protein J6Q88_04675, partial [Bacteroidales bacterium]|nr:hypothetical protein [Bacteroidales bacterium]